MENLKQKLIQDIKNVKISKVKFLKLYLKWQCGI